ncbi:MAG: alpha/beta hydrolase [Anaerolineales bacterium]|nr:alpha/beta hydrolase [Anaerolineales bacterium]
MNLKKTIIWLVLLVILIALIGFSIWAYTPLGPMPEAISAMGSTSEVIVEEYTWLVFQPVDTPINTGLVIYPGGRVDPRSYAPAAKQLAEDGFLVVIVPMPFNLAIFGWQKAGEVIENFPEIDHWVVAGHSLGGSMAARYAIRKPADVDGLVLWAAYPASSDDLSNSHLITMSIYGTNDGLITEQDITNSSLLLPENTSWVAIDGGNHAQFGWYGDQAGDNPASISREKQQQRIIESTRQIVDIVN